MMSEKNDDVIEEGASSVDGPVPADADTAVDEAEAGVVEVEDSDAIEDVSGAVEGDDHDLASAEALPSEAGAPEAPEAPVARSSSPAEAPSTREATKIGDLVVVGILAIILGVLLCLPTFLSGGQNSDNSDLSGGVAATVNGVAIGENEITDYISSYRSAMGLEDDAAWSQWMAQAGQDPEAVRSDIVNYFVSIKLIELAAEEQQVEASESDVEEQFAQIVEQNGGQEAFAETLASQNMTFDDLRESLRIELTRQALVDKVVQDVPEVDDAQVLEIMKVYYPDTVDEKADSLEGVDEETAEYVRSMLESSAREQAYSDWMSQYASNANITVTEMPKGLPYDVDVDQYSNADGANPDSAEIVEVTGDAESEDAGQLDEAADEGQEEVVDDEMAKGEK